MSSGQGGEPAAPGTGLGRLTEQEAKLVAKLLSDPTFFPIEFRTWLKQFIEGSGIIITASQIQGGTGSNIATGLPPGLILPVIAGAALPADCLQCDGTAKVRTDYPLLFNVIGVSWGAGDGSTTFNVPDLRDRALYGAGGIVSLGVAGADGVAFGSRGGPNHHHAFSRPTDTQGSHSHGGGTGGVGAHSHNLSGASTSGAPDHTHGPASLAFAETGGATINPQVGGPTARYIVADFHYATAAGGAHSHSVSGGTDSQNAHSHSIGSDGAHSHTVSGDTSGAYLQDRASFAGVIWAITIGSIA